MTIYSDSQSAVKALKGRETKSRLTLDTFNCLCKLASNGIVVKLCWIPGHSGHTGNVEADKLAGDASALHILGPEPTLPVPQSAIKEAIRKWCRARHTNRWRHTDKQKYLETRKWISFPLYGGKSPLWCTESRDLLRTLLGLFTGHCLLNKHKFRMKLVSSPTCPSCELEDESPIHFLTACPTYSLARATYFGNQSPTLSEIFALPASVILAYINATGRLKVTL